MLSLTEGLELLTISDIVVGDFRIYQPKDDELFSEQIESGYE